MANGLRGMYDRTKEFYDKMKDVAGQAKAKAEAAGAAAGQAWKGGGAPSPAGATPPPAAPTPPTSAAPTPPLLLEDKSLRPNYARQNPAWKGFKSPEARAYEASRLAGAGAGATPPPPPPPPPPSPTPPAGATPAAEPVPPKKPGMMSRAASWGLRGLGNIAPYAAGVPVALGAYKAVKDGTSDMDGQIGNEVADSFEENIGKNIREKAPFMDTLRSTLDSISPGYSDRAIEKSKNLTSSVVGATSNLIRNIGNNLPGPNLGDKVVGGLRDLFKGQELGTTKFEPAASPLYDGNAVNGPHTQGQIGPNTQPAPEAPAVDSRIPTSQGLRTPAELLSGTAVPDKGYGAFQRTGELDPETGQVTGAKGEAVGLRPDKNGYTARELAYLYGMDGSGGNGMRSEGTDLSSLQELSKNGPFGAMAALGAMGAIDRQRSNATTMGLRRDQINATNQLKLAEMNRAQQQKDIENARADRAEVRASRTEDRNDRESVARQEEQNLKFNTEEIGNRAIAKVKYEEPGWIQDRQGQAYKDKVAQKKAALTSDYEFTLQDDGKTLATASRRDIQKLHLADDIREKATESRGKWSKQLADYWGKDGTRLDSRNLKDFIPVGVEDSSLPFTKWVIMASGERVPITSVAKGGFNLTGPNDPADKQLTQLIMKAVELNKEKK